MPVEVAPVQALERVDAMARAYLERVASLYFAVAESPAEKEAVYRLRYQMVVARGWGEPHEYPDEMEYDEYDEHAVHVTGWEQDRLIAAARIVFPMPGARLPLEDAFDIVVEPRGRVADVQRMLVTRPYSGTEHRVFVALLARTWLEIRAQGLAHCCGAFVSAPMLRMLRGLGLTVRVLAPPRRYFHEERSPILIEAADSAAALEERWGPRLVG